MFKKEAISWNRIQQFVIKLHSFLERTVIPKEIEYNTCIKLCGENKLHHRQSETRQIQLFLRHLSRNFWIKIQKYEFILCFSYSTRSKVCKSDLKENCHVFKILPKDRPIEKLNRTMSIFQCPKIWRYLASWLLFLNNARPSVSKSGKIYLGTAGFKLQDIAKVECAWRDLCPSAQLLIFLTFPRRIIIWRAERKRTKFCLWCSR